MRISILIILLMINCIPNFQGKRDECRTNDRNRSGISLERDRDTTCFLAISILIEDNSILNPVFLDCLKILEKLRECDKLHDLPVGISTW